MASPNQSALTLVHELSRVEWGELGGAQLRSHRVILETLARMQYAGKCDLRGQITTTIQQIASAAGYSLRHAADAMRDLADAGYVHWERGGVIDGIPRPSFIRIVKKRIVTAIHAARAPFRELEKARAEVARRRIADLMRRRAEKKQIGHYRRSRHKATAATPYNYVKRDGSAPGALPPSSLAGNAHKTPKSEDMHPNHPLYAYLPAVCNHSAGAPTLCPYCTEDALKVHAQERADRLAQEGVADALFNEAQAADEAYRDYMEKTYPGVHPRYWARIVKDDAHAKALAIAAAEAHYKTGN